jgi:glyoxylase-like metal-dependent hydrolase (beta-lactamase superfamily II)/rhodanese-related sulfurtransferase
MNVEQIYTGCLAQGAYYITSNGEAAIIDPLREIGPYLQRAEKDGVRIKYVFETHFHADFVSGHLDLSKKTGAPIVYGPNADPAFEAIIARDGQEFKIGNVIIVALHTPGHTMESTCYLLKDESGKNHALFSGDTLFLGDVGRPDLAQKSASMTQEQLAGLLYDSLMNKIMPLEDSIIVYPAHGAGSACGKNMMKETVDTLGNQKKMNYALNQPNKESFIKEVTDGLLPPPGYFGMNVAMNKKGYDRFEEVLARGLKPIRVDELAALIDISGAVLLDVRGAADFSKGFIPGSINIGLKGDFAPWVGALIVDVKTPIVLVTAPGDEQEAVTRLARVGFDHVLGFVDGGFEAWKNAGKETDSVHRITASQFSTEFEPGKSVVIDVRKDSEYAAEHVDEAYSRPLATINEWFGKISDQPFFLHCQGGYRSMIAASILKSRGIHHFKEVDGGFKAIAETSVPKSDFVCQSKTVAS